jgi:hypothetical protein
MTVSRRHLLVTVVMLISIGLGGCITTNPAVQADTSNSTVFEQFSAAEPWTSGKVRTSTTLSYNATRSLGITDIVVINERGTVVSTSTINAGQTSVILMLPVNQNVTVVAMNDTGYAIENQTVTTTGQTIV